MGIKIFGQNILKGVKHDYNLAVFSPGPSVESEGQTYRIQQSWFSNIGTKRKTLVPFVWFSLFRRQPSGWYLFLGQNGMIAPL